MNLKQVFVARKVLISISCIAFPALLFYSLSILILTSSGFTIREVVKDPAQLTGLSSFLGFLSNIGVWLWVSSTAVCFYSVFTNPWKRGGGLSELMLLMGLFSLILAVDDLFLLHERYVYDKGIFLIYAFCAFAILIRHYRKIIEIDGFTFLLAGLLLASSVEIDLNQRRISFDYAYIQMIEEGCKFVGAALWLFFIGQAAAFRPPES